MYTIAYENKDIVVRFNEESVDKKLLANFKNKCKMKAKIFGPSL